MSEGDGTLVALEGIDGSGKSTLWSSLSEVFPAATMTCEPTATWYGQTVERSLKKEGADPLAELFLYLADHAAHLADIVSPALDRDELVISDRYVGSRIAYQGVTLAEAGFEEPMGFVEQAHEPWSRRPDLTIYVDVPPAVGARRSEGTNKFERRAFLSRVRENYEWVLERASEQCVRIDGTQQPAKVCASAVSTIEKCVSN